jgi:hypothetical protein
VTQLHGLRSLRRLNLKLHAASPLPTELRRPFTYPHSLELFPRLATFKCDGKKVEAAEAIDSDEAGPGAGSN